MMEAVEKWELRRQEGNQERWGPEAKHKTGLEREGGIPWAKRCWGVEEEGEEDCKLAPGCGPQSLWQARKQPSGVAGMREARSGEWVGRGGRGREHRLL